MPLNEHLMAYNAARITAQMNDANEFLFRGNKYVKTTWKTGIETYRRADSHYRGSKRKKSKRRKSRKN